MITKPNSEDISGDFLLGHGDKYERDMDISPLIPKADDTPPPTSHRKIPSTDATRPPARKRIPKVINTDVPESRKKKR